MGTKQDPFNSQAEDSQPLAFRKHNRHHPWKKTVLVVDDEEDFCRFLGMQLEAQGYFVEIAYNGLDGLEKARRVIPDLIILDLTMPKMPGEAVCTAIKDSYDEQLSAIPILVLTGRTDDTDRVVSRAMGADAFITKPFKTGDLFTQIEQLIP